MQCACTRFVRTSYIIAYTFLIFLLSKPHWFLSLPLSFVSIISHPLLILINTTQFADAAVGFPTHTIPFFA